jgi:hypothetical protein
MELLGGHWAAELLYELEKLEKRNVKQKVHHLSLFHPLRT